MSTQIQHILKFKLWILSNTYLFLKPLIRYLGRLFGKIIERSWKDKLAKKLVNISPNNEYVRDENVFVQVMVITSGDDCHNEINGIDLLLNHMRVPYYIDNMQSIGDKFIYNLSLVIFSDRFTYERNKFLYSWNKDTVFLIFNERTKNINTGKENDSIFFIKGLAYKLLPSYDGLRSEFAANVINTIKKIVKIPLVTGMPTKSIGLRIDDVKGDNADLYLNEILKYGWYPDLGIFLDDIKKCKKSTNQFLSDLNKNDKISVGPHAYSNEKFIFYNYPRGVSYSKVEFDGIWSDVLSQFEKYGFNLSPVINAHFHVLSKSSASKIVKNGVKYFFSELEIGKHQPVPNKEHWPSGDPINCTGRFNDSGVFQLSSGDNILDTLSSKSYYDFLMHSNDFNLDTIRKRVLRRLKMSLDCGFAAYITTHEYLINDMGLDKNKELWRLIDLDLQKKLDYKVIKSSLGGIGIEFEVMRNSMINSVRFNKGVLNIEMKGSVKSNDSLSIFKDNKIFNILVPSYTKNHKIKESI